MHWEEETQFRDAEGNPNISLLFELIFISLAAWKKGKKQGGNDTEEQIQRKCYILRCRKGVLRINLLS